MQAITLFSDHENPVKSSPKYKKWHLRDSKFKNFPYKVSRLRRSTRTFGLKELPTALILIYILAHSHTTI
jgi:hypothetical protein